jgi:hypothetical protein
MKTATIFIVYLILAYSAMAQEAIKKDCFLSNYEYRNGSPSVNIPLTIEKRSQTDIAMSGGNDYKVESANPDITKKYIKQELWAIRQGDALFINCFKLNLGWWYARALTVGRYICLDASLPSLIQLRKDLGLNSYSSATGGAIAGAANAKQRILYIYDSRTEKVLLLDEKTMPKILEADAGLLKTYQSEGIKNREVLLNYIVQLNSRSY